MTDLSDDHMHLLALARRAFDAEQGPLWRDNPEAAVDRHGAACDALWDELQRQVDMQDGKGLCSSIRKSPRSGSPAGCGKRSSQRSARRLKII